MSTHHPQQPPRIAIQTPMPGTPEVAARAAQLAKTLDFPIAHPDAENIDLFLVVDDDSLSLRETGPHPAGPIFADLEAIAPKRPTGPGHQHRNLLARAIGFTSPPPTVFDATAGLGRDAFRFALLGCNVTACERSPITAALLEDGLRRARRIPYLDTIITDRFTLITADARDALRDLSPDAHPDAIFLDPMFPPDPSASATVKKEMRIFRKLLGTDSGTADLLTVARQTARKRVVVKRMRHTPHLEHRPDITFKGKVARYDVYLTPRS